MMLDTTMKGRSCFFAAVFAAIVCMALPSFAADWTDANNATYTALKSINGGGNGTTAGGFIITDITLAGTEIVKFKVKTPAAVSANGCVYCARSFTKGKKWTLDATQFTGFRLGANFRIDRMGTQTKLTDVTCTPTTEYSVSADYTTGAVTVNNAGQSQDLGTVSYPPGGKLSIFASYSDIAAPASPTASSSWGNYLPDDLYYLQLWNADGETLKHDFRPAVCDSNSVTGLYDTVTGTFYPATTGKFTGTAYRANEHGGKKWTGLGGDNKMSNAANWANNDMPEAGDDIDFTIAVPNAEIDANIDATFGKVWLGAGDLPAFTGTLSATAVNDLTRMQTYDTATADFTFTLAAQDFAWNGGAAANWSDANVWMNADAAATWADNNNAIFNTANATVTLNDNVTANSLAFDAPATIGGAATLTASSVSVASDVTAVISAPTVGALEKTGAGALTLTENRTDVTTLTEGTLALVGTASLDWTQLAFGTDSAKPVTLEVGPDATIANIPSIWEVKSANGVDTVFCKQGGDWSLGSGALYLGGTSGATASFQHNGGTLNVGGYLSVGEGGTGLLDICGGTVESTHSGGPYTLIGNTKAATVVVTNSGSLVVSGPVAVGNNSGSSGTLVVADGGTVSVGGSLIFCNRNASTSGRVDLGRGGVIAAVNAYRKNAGSAMFNFDGGTFVKTSETGNVFPVNGAASAIDVSVSTNGGTIDNNGLAITIPCTIAGVGGLTLSGAGTTTISANQSYTGTTTVSNGTTLSVGGVVTFAGPVVFAAGSVLDIAEYVGGVTPLSATSLTFPESGNVPLTFNGDAFITGAYAICPTSLVSVAQAVAKFAPSTGGLGCSWDVSAAGDLLLLVGDIHGYSWTGLAGDNKFATGGNWVSGIAPSASGPVDFSAVTSDITVDMDGVTAGTIFGAVTMGTGVITFTGSLSATSFVSESLPGNPTKNVAVGANSSVTIDGDLVFAGTGDEYICNTVAAGGRFVVTGDIVATPDKGVYLRPSVTTSIAGVIAAKGLVNNSGKVNCFVLAPASGQVNWEVGENGISGDSDFMVSNYRSETATATIIAATNFTIAAAITNNRLLVLNTSNTVGEPCTITIGNGLAGLISGVGGVQTLGSGKVLFNSVSTFGNELGLYGTSTVAVNSGCRPGNGVVHANTGTAFEIAKSGTVTLNGDLTLDSETTLAFNFTERANPPVLALAEGKSVVFTEGASTNIAVKVSGDVWPTGGEKVLTTCGGFNAEIVSLAAGAPKWASGLAVNGDGNIVLSVKPKPMVIVVR